MAITPQPVAFASSQLPSLRLSVLAGFDLRSMICSIKYTHISTITK